MTVISIENDWSTVFADDVNLKIPRPAVPGEGGVVYVSLTRAKITDQPVEDAKIVAEEMVRWLRDIEGFDGFLMLTGESSAIGSPSGRAVRSRLGIRSPAGSSSSACCRSRESALEERADFEVAFADVGPLLAASSG